MAHHARLTGMLCGLLWVGGTGASAQSGGVAVGGNLVVKDKGGKRAGDTHQAVIWLERSGAPAAAARRLEIPTRNKEFVPHVLVVPAGSQVAFPNHDPFSHNVFSLSQEASFDLGLYERGETRTTQFPRAGIVRVYCNVHARMNAILVVRDNPWVTQPASDGSFTLPPVPPGTYTLRVWHERGGELALPLEVHPGLAPLALEVDASGFRYKQHLNKFGKPYPAEGRRY